MINLSDACNNLHTHYRLYSVNDSLRYDFVHNGYNCRIYYVDTSALRDLLTLVVEINNVLFPFSIAIFDPEHVSEYIPPEIYSHTKPVFQANDYSPHPFFQHIGNAILNEHVMHEHVDITRPDFYHYQNESYKPYFWRFVRQRISKDKKDRIYKSYPSDLAKRLITFCFQEHVNPHFTSDQSRAKDIVFSMRNYVPPKIST